MTFQVQLTRDAARNLEDIYHYIDRHSSSALADYFLGQVEKVFQGLSEGPRRGSFPAELLDIGFHDYREVSCKPYRIIYRVLESTVYVLLITEEPQDTNAAP